MIEIMTVLGFAMVLMVLFFGIPHFIFKKFDKNVYVVSIALLCILVGLMFAIFADFVNTPRSYGYIPEDEITVYDLANSSGIYNY